MQCYKDYRELHNTGSMDMILRKGMKMFFLVLVIAVLVYLNFFREFNQLLVKILYSVIIVLIVYIVNDFIYALIKKQVRDVKEKYALRKALSTILSILGFGAILAVWFKETETIVVAYGILSAGVAIALQDLLKNIAGGIIIFITGHFKAGDRIQVANDVGDVLDIRILYTAMMEIQEWVDGDQYSGRILMIPNSFVLNQTVKNYTKDFSFIWDEIHLMITYDSNLKKAQDIAMSITHEITEPFKISAKNDLIDMGEKYLISRGDVDEKIYTKITDNWIDLRLRYVVDPRQRRRIRHELNEKILEAFSREKDIKIASATFEIVGFPKVRIEKE